MQDLTGKTAFITGGASGIGLGMARAFAGAGMKVVLADIEEAALAAAVTDLSEAGAEATGLPCDVSDRASLSAAADAAFETYGKVHLLANNAGVAAGGPMEQIAPGDWDWVLGVNLMGVIHGIQALLPRIKAQGEGGHIVNTASMAGMLGYPMSGPYGVVKFAVVGLSETLAEELAGSGIGVSVLCPGWVRTGIADSRRNRPDRFGMGETATRTDEMTQSVAALLAAGLDPDDVGRRVLDAVRAEQRYIFTHPDMRGALEQRFQAILAAYDAVR